MLIRMMHRFIALEIIYLEIILQTQLFVEANDFSAITSLYGFIIEQSLR